MAMTDLQVTLYFTTITMQLTYIPITQELTLKTDLTTTYV